MESFTVLVASAMIAHLLKLGLKVVREDVLLQILCPLKVGSAAATEAAT